LNCYYCYLLPKTAKLLQSEGLFFVSTLQLHADALAFMRLPSEHQSSTCSAAHTLASRTASIGMYDAVDGGKHIDRRADRVALARSVGRAAYQQPAWRTHAGRHCRRSHSAAQSHVAELRHLLQLCVQSRNLGRLIGQQCCDIGAVAHAAVRLQRFYRSHFCSFVHLKQNIFAICQRKRFSVGAYSTSTIRQQQNERNLKAYQVR
jgi:hypothetical protein